MKRILSIILLVMLVLVTACGEKENQNNVKLEISQMEKICELSVMDCYCHEVAKFSEKDASGILLWKKDKHFWVEYVGIVTLGIDMELLNIEVTENKVSITLPDMKVLSCKVDSSSLTSESYIVDKDSAKIEADDEVHVFALAQEQLLKTAQNDKTLLGAAKERVQTLLTQYINNIGNLVGVQYEIEWLNA